MKLLILEDVEDENDNEEVNSEEDNESGAEEDLSGDENLGKSFTD